MNNRPTASITEHFASLEDPRIERTKLHQLLDIIVIAICAVICGADDWVAVELFGNAKLAWLRTFLELPNGIPAHDTFGRVSGRLKPEQFQQCFLAWIQAVSDLTRGQVIAIDGKVLRGSCERVLGKAGIDMVSDWATANHLVLGQIRVDDKSNEITAIPKLLQVLEIAGCIVTIDALGCQTDITQAIVERGADYVLAVKENQGHLYEDIKGLFDAAQEVYFKDMPHAYAKTTDKNHGRMELRLGQIRSIALGVARLIDSYAEGLIEKGEFEPWMARLRQRIAALEAQAQQIADSVQLQADLRMVIGRLDDFAAKVKDGLGEADWLTRRDISHALVKRVEMRKDQVNVDTRPEIGLGG